MSVAISALMAALLASACGRMGFTVQPRVDEGPDPLLGDAAVLNDAAQGIADATVGTEPRAGDATVLNDAAQGIADAAVVSDAAQRIVDAAQGPNPGPDDAATSFDWFDAAMPYRRSITLAPASAGAEDLTHFPVLVSAYDPTLRGLAHGGHVAQPDGGDIAFVADDGVSALAHELERYVAESGELVAWVKVPRLSASQETVIYMYYGGSDPQNRWNVQGVWDDGGAGLHRGVWHLGEPASAARADATGHANACVPGGYDGDEPSPGIAASADQLDGSDDWLTCGQGPSLNVRDQVTVSAWIKPGKRLARDDWGNGPYKVSYGLYLFGKAADVTTLGIDFKIAGKRYDVWDRGRADIPPGSWAYLVATFDGQEIRAYVNGELDYTVAAPGQLDDLPNEPLTISWRESSKEFRHLNGSIDEVRVSSTARTAAWIRASYQNQLHPTSFAVLGAEVPRD